MFFLLDGGQKILGHRYTFTSHQQTTALQGVDDLVSIAKTTADQRHIAISLSRARDDLREYQEGRVFAWSWRDAGNQIVGLYSVADSRTPHQITLSLRMTDPR